MAKRNTKFKPGNNGNVEQRKRNREKLKASIPPCPPSYSFMRAAWDQLAEKALRGCDKSLHKLWEIAEREVGQGGKSGEAINTDRRPIANNNLPPACRALRESLDIDIAYIVQRHEMGLPESEPERLLAETSLAIRDSGLKGRAARRGEQIAKAWKQAMELLDSEESNGKE